MLLRVQVGSVTLNGFATTGFIIARDGFVGWDESTSTKRDSVVIPQAHGSYPVPGFRDVRVLTVTGICLADSEQQLQLFGAQLTGTGADGNAVRVTVDHAGSTTWADGYLDGDTKFSMFAAGQAANFAIAMWFPNPRKFGNTLTFASGVPAYHYGNFPAAPVLTITGSMSLGYSVFGPTGKLFTVTAALAAGQTHTIDLATGYLKVNGVLTFGAVSRGDLWVVPGGGSVIHTLVPVFGSGALSAAVTDTFI